MARKKEINVNSNFYLDGGVFPFTVMLVLGYDFEGVSKALQKTGAHEWLEAIKAEDFADCNYKAMRRDVEKKGKAGTFLFIYIKEQFRFTDYEYCKLAHEVLHICQFVMPDFLNMEREFEAVAYTHTHLMEQCIKELRLAYAHGEKLHSKKKKP